MRAQVATEPARPWTLERAAGPHAARRSRSRERPGLPLDPVRISLFVLLLISLSRIHIHLGLGRFRLALVMAGIAVAVAVLNPRLLNAGKLLQHWPAKVVVALGVLACISAPFGLSLGASATFILENYSKVLILFLLLVAATRDERDLRFFMWGFVISCAILAYFALFVFTPRATGQGVVRLGHLYSYDANDIGCILVSGLPIAMLLFQTSRKAGKLVAGWALFGIGASAAISGSRGTFLGLLVVGGALLFIVREVSGVKKVGFLFAVLMSLAIFAPPGYWEQMKTLTSPTEDYNWTTYYGRKQTAERALGYMMRHPFTGIGIDNFARAEGTISDRAATFVDRTGYANRWRASHNSFLQAGSELGLPGLILWSSLVFGGIFGLRKLRKRMGGQLGPRGHPDRFLKLATQYLPVSMIGFATTAFFISFAWLDPLYILVAFITGVYICAEGRRFSPPIARAATRRPSAVARSRHVVPAERGASPNRR